ncbi:MAG: hypothetical protein J6K04_02470 [Lachnospiraceae bacterium]|nr:hypothetical protein [Lachnospiraceae bacterium]
MNNIYLSIWGRQFDLSITYDCYSDEEILDSQKMALEAFIRDDTILEASLNKVKEYCLSVNRAEVGSDSIENIFKFVMPKYIYVPRETKKHIVAVMCNYRFDQEHGIAIIFENEKFLKVDIQDNIL